VVPVVLIIIIIITIVTTPHTADMALKGNVAQFPQGKTKIDIVDVATDEVVKQHSVEGTIGRCASMHKNIAAIALRTPIPGVHVIDMKSGVTLFKFITPDGEEATVTLSKDALTLAVGSDEGLLRCLCCSS